MKLETIVVLVVCGFAAASVVRDRRAVNTEEEVKTVAEICPEQTPCAWSVYSQGNSQLISTTITNTYCTCRAGTTCDVAEDDKASQALVYQCKSPSDPSSTPSTST